MLIGHVMARPIQALVNILENAHYTRDSFRFDVNVLQKER